MRKMFLAVPATTAVTLLAATCAPALSGAASSIGARQGATSKTATPRPAARLAVSTSFASPPTTAQCEAAFDLACYSPLQMRVAYGLNALYRRGFDGRGETIVIVDAFGSPTIRNDLARFDKGFHLPAPHNFRIIQPAGPVPPFNPKAPDRTSWSVETSLDVEYAHAMAPGANILLVETPVDETEGVQGFPQMMRAENYVVSHHLGQVISQSFAATEETFPSTQSLLRLRYAFKNAARSGVTVLAGSGDAGATDYKSDLTSFYLHRVTAWPASDPLVTAVGGTQLHLDAVGHRIEPDTVWNDTNLLGSPAAGGGGRSVVFTRPAYQDGVAAQVGQRRGVPDISMSAAVDGAALVYISGRAIGGGRSNSGFYLVGGTSEATPIFSGIVAIADQYAGHGLGLINPALYRLASRSDNGLLDVTGGTNTVTFAQGGSMHTVFGWDAAVGYDLASGWGTINAARFVPALVSAAGSR